MAWRGLGVALAALVWALAVQGRGTAIAATPSFDCSAAKVPIELLICGDDALAQADSDLAALYGRLQSSLDDAGRAALRIEQRTWLQARFQSCGVPQSHGAKTAEPAKATACLTALYKDRIAALSAMSPQPSTGTAAEASTPKPESLPTALGVEQSTLPATGKQHTILAIAEFGRYSVSVKSQQGVSLQLVDRMSGPGTVMGSPGESDGRLDTFLDRGHYKILLQASDKGSGDAAVSVHPFAELNTPEIPRLPDIKRIDTVLDDYQQRSYWLEIKERRTVAIEAAGRNLADMRLWRDGNWLVDATPTSAEIEPLPGKPLQVQRIVTVLEPGLYMLSAYGGPTKPWAKTSDEHPLHLRMGIPTLDEALRQGFVASPFGIDRFLVPASASYFRLELPEAEDASLGVSDYDDSRPYDSDPSATITKKSVPPVTALSLSSGNGDDYKIVTVHREAGKPYLLQYFQSTLRYSFTVSGDYWIQTLHSGYGEDNVDASGLLTKEADGYPERVIAGNAPELRPGSVWSRRFNMLGDFTVYFHVTEPGTYTVEEGGAKGEYRFQPMVHFPTDYKTPDYAQPGTPWNLERGYYILEGTPMPEGKGILDIKVASNGATSSEPQPKETSISFPRIGLDKGYHYTLYLNNQPGVEAGVILRSLPIDLGRGLPVVLRAGESLDIAVHAPKDGVVAAVAEDGKPIDFVIDHGAPISQWRADGTQHILTLANKTDKSFTLAMRFQPDALAPDTPLPTVSAGALAAVPKFPPLVPQLPAYFDIERDQKKTFALDVAQPGLYRVESTGLLQTEAAIRTRTIIALDHEENNGIGRNFLIQQYLGQGAYQVSLGSQGMTEGHMGVLAAQTILMDGGALSPGIPARNTLQAGNGIVYTFHVSVAGQYHLQALGLGRTYAMRLEDHDGWPIVAPNAPADYTDSFDAGDYRLVILPQPVDAKIVTQIDRIEEPVEPTGHGPHDLVLGQSQSFQWLEPEPGAMRVPDQWRFTLAGPAHVAIALSRGMRAELVAETDGKKYQEITGGPNWNGLLPTGSYVLKATTIEPNNRFDYDISVSAKELLAGQSRAVGLPADVPVSIGSDAVAEIGSFGTTDARAWLYDTKDKLVATNDDRPNDWNFAIAGRIKPGFYRLHLEAVGAVPASSKAAPVNDNTVEDGENDQTSEEGSEEGDEQAGPAETKAPTGDTTVSIYQAAETKEPVLAVGKDIDLSGPVVHLVPLNTAPGDLLVAAADAGGPAVGLSLEIAESSGWRTLSETSARSPWLALPVENAAGAYRLRVWSTDRSESAIHLQTRMVSLSGQPSSSFTGLGVSLVSVPGVVPALALGAVQVDQAGAYRLEQPLPGLAWATETGKALASDFTNVAFGKPGKFWFGARNAGTGATVQASKLVPGDAPVALTVRGSFVDPTVIADPVEATGAPILWVADSRLGQPGISTDTGGFAAGAGSSASLLWDARQKGVTLRLWNASDASAPLALRLRRIGFAKPLSAALDWGVTDQRIGGHQALMFTLPAGAKRLQLALPPQTMVTLINGKIRDDIWSGDAPLAITEDSNAEQLLVASAAASEAQLGIAATPLAPSDVVPVLGGGNLFKQYYAAEGVTRVGIMLSETEIRAVQGGGAMPVLHVAGVVKGTTLLNGDGMTSRDTAPKVDLIGSVDIAHGVGPVIAWLDGGDPLTSLDVAANGVQVSKTASVDLKGETQQIVFALDMPKFLHLKTTTPVITQQNPAGGGQNLRLFANGADLGLYLPKGTTPLVLRSAGDGELGGSAEATLIDIAPLNEGLGPKVRLTPGESRLYSFDVKDERDIGVGVRGGSDSAHCRVFDAAGNTVGSGVVQMLHLKAGTYLLAVDAPADGSAIEVQPALVGVAAPDGSPPDDVKRGYLELAGLKPKSNP